MKILILLLVLVIIYFIAVKLKVVHVSTLPEEQKTELNNRNKIRSMLLNNYIKCDENENKTNNNKTNSLSNSIEGFKDRLLSVNNSPDSDFYITSYKIYDTNDTNDISKRNLKKNYIPIMDLNIHMKPMKPMNIYQILDIITDEYLNDQYQFNLPNKPVTNRYPNKNTINSDKKYINHIKENINGWNETLQNEFIDPLRVAGIKLIFIMETEEEFIIKANVKLLYNAKTLHLSLDYYGIIDKSDDYLNGGSDTYIIQLINLKPIQKEEYQNSVKENNRDGPFMSMNEQMAYVERVNKMHENEFDE